MIQQKSGDICDVIGMVQSIVLVYLLSVTEESKYQLWLLEIPELR